MVSSTIFQQFLSAWVNEAMTGNTNATELAEQQQEEQRKKYFKIYVYSMIKVGKNV